MDQNQAQPIIDTKLIHLMIRNRRQVIYDGNVRAVTSRNDTGIFDVLPEHANFISTIKTQITIHKIDGEKQLIHLNNGIMKVKNSAIRCFIDLIAQEPAKKPQK